jgi:hypothetical protein
MKRLSPAFALTVFFMPAFFACSPSGPGGVTYMSVKECEAAYSQINVGDDMAAIENRLGTPHRTVGGGDKKSIAYIDEGMRANLMIWGENGKVVRASLSVDGVLQKK